jgi:hypothetical protein
VNRIVTSLIGRAVLMKNTSTVQKENSINPPLATVPINKLVDPIMYLRKATRKMG